MVRHLAIIGFGILLYLGLLASPSFAAKPDLAGSGNPHNSITLDEPDEGDNAHPSGKDRSVEHGGSVTQGKAASDPDDDSRGPERTNNGPDKQIDGAGGVDREDQDNNNGCGNDDDFEDDNEGLCGGAPKGGPGDGENGEEDRNGNGEQPKIVVEKPGEVLGIQSLPVTGGADKSLFIALSLLLAGTTLQVISRRLELLYSS